ncbi:GerMN domain-containing protein [Acidipropionibacterium thoenii]|uniref:GerMN domain-containing protein n=1 Tax=Acidipropionibacterium thoenii TaxID=1751 RepID=UPI0003FEB257|nr:GerMN domain-containing protein [Acidipropionibacterium thoenii]
MMNREPAMDINHHAMTRRRFLGLSGLTVLAGCARVPTTGPVTQVSASGDTGGRQGIAVDPQPPPRGASPDLVVAGFLQSMTSPQDGYRIAREYLTTDAARTWDPDSGAVIYDASTASPVVTGTSAGLKAPLIATLDPAGLYQPVAGANLSLDFGLTREDGELRISTPPSGLVLSQFSFERAFHSVALYFTSLTRSYLVPELVHLPAEASTPTTAVNGLLTGPSQWLSGAATNVFPTGTKLSSDAVPVDSSGVAVVPLSREVTRLTDAQRRQIAGQVTWSLSTFPEVSRVRFTVGGTDVMIPGAAEDDTVSTGLFTSMSPLLSADLPNMMVLKEGRLGQVADQSGVFSPLAGLLGSGTASTAPAGIAVDRSGAFWALVDKPRRTLLRWQQGARTATPLATGVGLLRPQVCTDGSCWTISVQANSSRFIVVGQSGQRIEVRADELATRRVLAFSVSPDMARIALVVAENSARRLAMLRIRPVTDQSTGVIADGLTELRLDTTDTNMALLDDVGWISATDLMVVARATTDSPGAPFQIAVDGSGGIAVGPLSGVDVVAVSTLPRADGINALALTGAGQVLRYEDRYRWRTIATGATAMGICV